MANETKQITEFINAESKKTRQELANIQKNLESDETTEEAMKRGLKEIEDKKKEIKDFSNMRKKDFSKMTTEELIELKKRMKDLGVGKALGGKVYSKNQPRKVSYVD